MQSARVQGGGILAVQTGGGGLFVGAYPQVQLHRTGIGTICKNRCGYPLMANMRASLAAGALVFVALDWATPAYAHGVEKVRRELTEQGFEQLEFQRTQPPFKLDACRDGQRFHLHVDYYGKVTEQTPIGLCDGEATPAPADETATEAAPEAAPVSPSVTSPNAPAAQELCSRYFADVGKTLRVQCE